MKSELITYYDDCHKDYQLAWRLDKNMAIHYGMYGEGATTVDQAAENSNRKMGESLALRPDDVVIDAGCGVGGTCFWLAERYDAKIIGVNIQPAHLEIAGRLVQSKNLEERVSFLAADYCSIPMDDGSVDAIYSIEGIGHCGDKQAFMREARRLLRPGGRLVIFDYFTREAPLDGRTNRRLEAFKQGWAMPSLPKVSAYRQMAEAAGFQSVVWEDMTASILPDSRRMRWLAGLALPRTYFRVWRGRRPAVVLGNRRSAWLQYDLFKRRFIHYGILIVT